MIDWDAVDMEAERGKRDFERRVEEAGSEVLERLERVERSCKEAEKSRRQRWEKLEGRVMTAAEKHQFELDGIRRTVATMTNEYVTVISAARHDLERTFAEARDENRAQADALMKILDRLPPG